ncbi:hypothetical protein ABZT17_04925 [Streptomyces sp. NPDC005648]
MTDLPTGAARTSPALIGTVAASTVVPQAALALMRAGRTDELCPHSLS